jgi:hypothetical protein
MAKFHGDFSQSHIFRGQLVASFSLNGIAAKPRWRRSFSARSAAARSRAMRR